MPRRTLIVEIASGSSLALLAAIVAGGCGSGSEEMICGPNGCSVCDADGCHAADPGTGSASANAGPTADGGACDNATTTCACETDEGCVAGTTCLDGLCLVPCEFTSQCGGGRVCLNGKCVVGCDALSPCPSGFRCSDKGACVLSPDDPECTTALDCVGGMACANGVCVGPCATNADCAAAEICDAATGTCLADPQPKAACETDPSVCTAGQRCMGGYCRFACTSGDGCKLIDARIPVCDEGVCKSEAEANPECLTKDDCEAGQDCVSNACK